MKNKGYDLDSLIKEQEEKERRNTQASEANQQGADKVLVGIVEKYFSKLGVAAINLEYDISIGDIIEIGDEEEAIRQRVKSMQIERKDVSHARAGDSVGILVRCPVKEGSPVYKVS